MTARLANEAAEVNDVVFAFFHESYASLLKSCVKQIRVEWHSLVPLACIREPFAVRGIRRTLALINQIAPEVVVVSQGNIEFSLKGLFAARIAKRITVSYLPLAYNFSAMKGSVLHWPRDLVDLCFYSLPHAFLVPSEEQRELARRKALGKPIYVIENVIFATDSVPHRVTTRAAGENQHQTHLNVAVIGRIDFAHKNTNVLIGAAKLLRARKIESLRFHVFGTGPDSGKLKEQIVANGLESYFMLHGWVEPGLLFDTVAREMDLALLPSNFETSPNLVFLECVSRGIPVVASDIAAFRNYLPAKYRIERHRDPESVCRKLLEFDPSSARTEVKDIWSSLSGTYSSRAFTERVRQFFVRLEERYLLPDRPRCTSAQP